MSSEGESRRTRRASESGFLLSRHGDEARPKALRDRIERTAEILNGPRSARRGTSPRMMMFTAATTCCETFCEPGIGGHLPAGHQMVDLLRGVDHLGVRRGWSVKRFTES